MTDIPDVELPGDDPETYYDADGNIIENPLLPTIEAPREVTTHAMAPGAVEPTFVAPPPSAPTEALAPEEAARRAHARAMAEVKGNFHRTMRGNGFR